MLTLLGTIFGLLGSLLPEILKYFKAKQDHKHEIEMARIQIEAMQMAGQIKLAEVNAMADIEETAALHKSYHPPVTGWKWADGLLAIYNGSVRPTITYLFMLLYMYVKVSMMWGYRQAGWEWFQIGQQIWSSEDFAVFATIISFHFGSRFLRYSLGTVKGK